MKSEKRAQKFHTDDASLVLLIGEVNFTRGTTIRSTTQISVVTRHQYGISARVSKTSFRVETSGGVAECRLFSQASSGQARGDSRFQISERKLRKRFLSGESLRPE